jgi:hypothetical protein
MIWPICISFGHRSLGVALTYGFGFGLQFSENALEPEKARQVRGKNGIAGKS